MSPEVYVTKPVEIEAMQYTNETISDMVEWVSVDGRVYFEAFYSKDEGNYQLQGEVYDYLHDTWIKVYEGQWIIRGTKGEFYPCDPETFDWKYQKKNA